MANRLVRRLRLNRLSSPLLLALIVTAIHVATPAAGQGQRDSIPSAAYFLTFSDYYEGRFGDALKNFNSEGRGAIKGTQGRWLDSICYYTMSGECHYHLGHYPEALADYTAALQLFLSHSNWMIRIQPKALRPVALGKVKTCPWGRSTRNARIADVPETMSMGQGILDNSKVLKSGGVVQPPTVIGIQGAEIARCVTLSLRRRRELMGPTGPHDPLNAELIQALSRRPVPPNDWKEAWIDIQLGLAFSCVGNDGQAKGLLQRGLLAGGEFDHPLSPIALYELGRIAFSESQMEAAGRWFEEASYSAYQFEDPQLAEEALRYASLIYMLGNPKGAYPALEPASSFARTKRLAHLQVSCTLSAAEGLANCGRAAEASELLAAARTAIGKRDMGRGRVGARLGYLTALSLYQQGKARLGDEALAPTLAFQRGGGSLWLYHLGLVDALRTNGTVSDRVAMALYENVLREPQTVDWTTDPLESLSILATPHMLPFEHWFETALERKEYERALEIGDLLRRHRFLSALPMGGRLLALKWLLEGPEDLLDQQARLQKQDLLNRHPLYKELAQQVHLLRHQLKQRPVVAEDDSQRREQVEKLAKIAELSLAQEVLLREVALRREPCSMSFPPKRAIKDIQAALGEEQSMLVFLATSRHLYGCLVDRQNYPIWEIGSLAALRKNTELMLRGLGNFESNHVVTLSELRAGGWQEASAKIREALFKGSKAQFPGKAEELVIVPDSFLWYLPFEALLVGEAKQQVPLITKLRVRYSPTIALALPDSRGRHTSASTPTVVGKLMPGASESTTTAAFQELSDAVSGMTALRAPLPAPSSIYSILFDRLVVLDDILPLENGPLAWSPVTIDKSAAGSTLDSWMSLPWGGPDRVVLPAFHTPAENSLKKISTAQAGADLFFSSCALMASGTRTILFSRWRTGGQSSIDLTREFLQELPHAPAAAAWQRSVFLALDAPLTVELEPRLKVAANDEPPTASHPFFWAGYLLVDNGAPPFKSDDAAPQKIDLKPAPPKQQVEVKPAQQP